MYEVINKLFPFLHVAVIIMICCSQAHRSFMFQMSGIFSDRQDIMSGTTLLRM
jgi:hypothetical protein